MVSGLDIIATVKSKKMKQDFIFLIQDMWYFEIINGIGLALWLNARC
ncbi:hypothetical protein MED297_09276 [Reinekea sp. MED297]|uniref:Uncharacterized protein n=1 Tax=Reinekea blandensis MED297 TaxID=314283 RepID=A4BHR5_9GAMM|nr:hypothetical protein MED297_09276 [Reinekea sp. MED297] [Reinekea blandensis MED297]